MGDFWSGLRPRTLMLNRSYDHDKPVWLQKLLLPWDALTWIWWRGVVYPVRINWLHLRQWWARGNEDSYYWVPRVGDRVDACTSPAGSRVVSVSIRKDVVVTDDGNKHSLLNCCAPHDPVPPAPRIVAWCSFCLDGFTAEDVEDGEIVGDVCAMCRKAGRGNRV